jgi:hypothetical protein
MTPDEEERVRRALADAARTPTSMPPRVAERMDDVLAELVDTRRRESADEFTGRAVDREVTRRRWPALLAAAAVVCLVALGGSAILRAVTTGDQGAASSASASRTVTDGGRSAPGNAEAALPPPRLHRATLPRDVRRALAAVPLSENGQKTSSPGKSGRQGLAQQPRTAIGCRTPSQARNADVVDVLLDGKPATLVVAAPRAGTREARVYSCQDPSVPVATTRVPVP